MSASVVPIESVRILEPRLKINEPRMFGCLEGGQNVSWKSITTQSFSTSSVQFTTPPPNPGIIVDRKVYLRMFFTLTFAGDTGNPLIPLLSVPPAGSADAPRAYPLSNGVITTMSVNINNTSVNINMNDVMGAMLWYNTPVRERNEDYSFTPSMLDQSQEYSDLFQLVRNPLGQYGDNTTEMARGGFAGVTITSNTQTAAVVQLEICEPIFLSPFVFGHKNQSGFIGVQNLDWNITFGDLQRLWSHDSVNGNVATFTSLAVTLPTSPQMLFNYITPKELTPIPKQLILPYFDVQRYITDNGVLAAGGTTTISSNNIQLQSIPSRLYIYARRRNADRTQYTTDSFAWIQSLSLNWNGVSGLFSQASPQDLFRMSCDNGCQMSWSQWSKFTGSVLCIEFAKDLGLSSVECPGLLSTYQLQMNVNIKNTGSAAVNYSLYVVAVSSGSFTILDNRSVSQIGVVTKADVLNAKTSPMIDYNVVENMYGGNFFSGLKDFIGKAASKIGDILPYVGKAVSVARMLTGSGSVGGGIVGGGIVGAGSVGGRMRRKKRGGMMLSRSELKEALDGY